MINHKCDKCTFLSARALVDGKLQWGNFCVLPAYRDDEPVVEIRAGHICPLVEVLSVSFSVQIEPSLMERIDYFTSNFKQSPI